MQKQIQEEPFNITGWQDNDEKIFQDGFYRKRPNQEIEQLRKKETIHLSKLPFRQHRRHKTKDIQQSYKGELSNLREDKRLLQRYLYAQDESKVNTCRDNTQPQFSPPQRVHIQNEVVQKKLEKLRDYRSTQNDEKVSKHFNSILDKYTLFSGTKAQIIKKRRFLLQTQSKENLPRQKLKTELLSLESDLINSKAMLEKKDKSKDIFSSLVQNRKKKLKFPLFFRELTSKQQKKIKLQQTSSFNFQKSVKMTRTPEFMDDGIFSSKGTLQ